MPRAAGVTESSRTLDFSLTDRVRLRVERRPFSIVFLLDGRQVLRTSRSGALFARRGGRELRSRVLRSWRDDPSGIRLRVSSTAEVDFFLEARALHPFVSLTLRLCDDGPCEALGASFDSPRSDAWFGAEVMAASQWPLNGRRIRRDPFLPTGNQAAPLWLSQRGAALFRRDHQPIGFSFHDPVRGTLRIHGRGAAELELCVCVSANLREAHRAALCVLGSPRRPPPVQYFSAPMFSTWIEFLTRVDQEGILGYSDAMREHGFPCGVLVIDDRWTRHYGDLSFDPSKFPDPRHMVEVLHSRGCRVALWVTPFLDSASARYGEARRLGYLLRRKDQQEPFLGTWWNGKSALVDFSRPEARAWFVDGLQALVRDVGVDGFKLDAGDAEFLSPGYDSFAPMNPWEYADAFASIGALFPFNELRVSWLTQGLGLVQRLRDKSPTWDRAHGLGSIVPHGLCEGLLGYPYFCADMIGGGWDAGFRAGTPLDEELFVRWTQASAMFPIMQFSYAPWRLSPRSAEICRQYVELHERMSPYIYELAREAARDGTPIVRPLFFEFPSEPPAYRISDQFLLGSRFLVAPVLRRGARHRPVYLPRGTWRDFWTRGELRGPRPLRAYPAGIGTLPIFERVGR